MDLDKVLAELRSEREAIDVAIHNLERLVRPGKLGPTRPLESVTRSQADGTNGFHGNSATGESS